MKSRSSRRYRRGLAALAALAIIPMLAACGSSGGNGDAGKVDGSKIVLQTISALQPTFQKFADAYMKEYPKRKVEVRATTDDGTAYAQQLATARISGKLPDVFFNVDWLANTLASNNVTLDMAPGIKEGKLGKLRIDDFLPQFVGLFRPLQHPDQVTGLPVSADSVALFYNKDTFKKAGVTELPKASWTWDDMYRVAAEIHTKSGGKYVGLGSPLVNGGNLLTAGPVLKAFGADYYNAKTNKMDIASPDAIKAWTLLLGAYGDVSGPYSAAPTAPKELQFQSGNVAMAFATSGTVPSIRQTMANQDWDVIPMPKINGKSTAGGGAYGLSIAQTSKNQDAAWAFMSWFYDANKGMKVAEKVANAIPPTNEGIDHGTWRDVTPPANIGSFAKSARSAILMTPLPGSAGTTLTDAAIKATQQVELNGMSIKEAFTQAQDTVNAQLAKDAPKKK